MSQRQTTSRHNLIINKLRRDKRVTFQDICDYLERESNLQGENLTISKRTFTRDLSDIGDIYGIYIKFDWYRRLERCCYFVFNQSFRSTKNHPFYE